MDIPERFNSIFFATAKLSTKCDGQLLLQSATRFITLRQEVQSANNITRKIKNVCRHLWEKRRFIKSLPNVNASSLSPPRSQYQLNWTNGTGDINCSCNWLKYFTIKQQ